MRDEIIALKILKFLAAEYPGEFNVNIAWKIGKISKWSNIPCPDLEQFIKKISQEGEETRKREYQKYLQKLISQDNFVIND